MLTQLSIPLTDHEQRIPLPFLIKFFFREPTVGEYCDKVLGMGMSDTKNPRAICLVLEANYTGLRS